MTEYIERGTAIAKLTALEVTKPSATMTDAKRLLADMPSADVAPVVRCKDCKYWQDNNDGYPHEECRWGHGETPDANDFCSYGERRGERDG